MAETKEKRLAASRWHNQLPKVILGVKFTDGIEAVDRKLKPLPPDFFRRQHSAIAWAGIAVLLFVSYPVRSSRL